MADIVLKSRDGNPINYPGVTSVKLNTVGGEVVEFIDPNTVPGNVEMTIDPDFSDGDMVVTPEEGTVFSNVTVTKPGTLIPENIAEGVDIAGIVGTLVAGSTDSSIKTFGGSVTLSGSTVARASVNFGFLPNVLIVYHSGNATLSSTERYFAFIGFDTGTYARNIRISSTAARMYSAATVDSMYGTTGDGLSDVSESGFTVRNLHHSGKYYIQAIGGLT